MLTFENVDFYYHREKPILQDITFSIQPGEFVAIVGPNGSGKSTLSKLINGLLLPEKGAIRYREWDTRQLIALEEIRSNIGFVFQNPDDQFITTTVRDEIIFGLENIRVPKQEMDERVFTALQAVDMGSKLHRCHAP